MNSHAAEVDFMEFISPFLLRRWRRFTRFGLAMSSKFRPAHRLRAAVVLGRCRARRRVGVSINAAGDAAPQGGHAFRRCHPLSSGSILGASGRSSCAFLGDASKIPVQAAARRLLPEGLLAPLLRRPALGIGACGCASVIRCVPPRPEIAPSNFVAPFSSRRSAAPGVSAVAPRRCSPPTN